MKVCAVLSLALIAAVALAGPAKKMPASKPSCLAAWETRLLQDSAWFMSHNEAAGGKKWHNELDKFLSAPEARCAFDGYSRGRVLEQVRLLGLRGLAQYVTIDEVMPVLVAAVSDTSEKISSMAKQMLNRGVSRKLLRSHKSDILSQRWPEQERLAMAALLAESDQEKDSLLNVMPANALGWRAALGDTAARSRMLLLAFPDSAFLQDSATLIPRMPGEAIGEARYNNYCRGLEVLENWDEERVWVALNTVLAKEPRLAMQMVEETFSYRVIQRYARFHEEDSLLAAGLSLIRAYKSERVLDQQSIGKKQWYSYVDSLIWNNWKIHLPQRQGDSVWLFRNYYSDPPAGRSQVRLKP